MPAALIALLLVAATADPRLAEPLWLLAEGDARDTTDGHLSPQFTSLPDSLNLRLTVAELPRGAAGRYEARARTVTVAQAVTGEDPRVLAVVLAHELQHALDQKRIALELLNLDCLALEVRGFAAQASVTRLFWPDDLPNGTRLERHMALVVRDF
jgi:hypothetical protein